MPSIKLQSSDGEVFEVDVEIAKQSVTIKTMLEGKNLSNCCHTVFVHFLLQHGDIALLYNWLFCPVSSVTLIVGCEVGGDCWVNCGWS